MGNQQVLRIVLSLAILAAFFLPVNNSGTLGLDLNVSAWDVVSETLVNIGNIGNMPWEFFLLLASFLVILIAAVLILVVSVLRRRLPTFVSLLPFLAIIVLLTVTFVQSPLSASETTRSFGNGFYILMIASFLLLFTNINVEETVAA